VACNLVIADPNVASWSQVMNMTQQLWTQKNKCTAWYWSWVITFWQLLVHSKVAVKRTLADIQLQLLLSQVKLQQVSFDTTPSIVCLYQTDNEGMAGRRWVSLCCKSAFHLAMTLIFDLW